jgi:hypothetical protein
MIKNNTTFRWTMVGCSVLDIVLLFWMLNPFPHRMDNARLCPELADIDVADSAISKPTPLGIAPVRVLLASR